MTPENQLFLDISLCYIYRTPMNQNAGYMDFLWVLSFYKIFSPKCAVLCCIYTVLQGGCLPVPNRFIAPINGLING